MAGQRSFFDADERLRELSEAGDPLERLLAVVDFEIFRGELSAGTAAVGSAQGRPRSTKTVGWTS
jgi:transposase, IS5 family